MKRKFHRLPLFFTAFFLTLLLAVGIAASAAALIRMENATQPQGYTLFSLREEGESLTLTLFNTQMHWELAPIKRSIRELRRITLLLPVEWRSAWLLVNRVEAGFDAFWRRVIA